MEPLSDETGLTSTIIRQEGLLCTGAPMTEENDEEIPVMKISSNVMFRFEPTAKSLVPQVGGTDKHKLCSIMLPLMTDHGRRKNVDDVDTCLLMFSLSTFSISSSLSPSMFTSIYSLPVIVVLVVP